MVGRIIMYNEDRGFGFIFGEDEEDYFFHISEFKDTKIPKRDNVVSFTEGNNQKGKVATGVYYEAYDMEEYEEKIRENTPKSKGMQALETAFQLCYFFFY